MTISLITRAFLIFDLSFDRDFLNKAATEINELTATVTKETGYSDVEQVFYIEFFIELF